MVGDIYLGKIARVMPGIRAAFIDIGHKQDAFLHFSDVDPNIDDYSSLIGEEGSEIDDEDDDEGETVSAGAPQTDQGTRPQQSQRPQQGQQRQFRPPKEK